MKGSYSFCFCRKILAALSRCSRWMKFTPWASDSECVSTMCIMPAGITRAWRPVRTVFWHPPAAQRGSSWETSISNPEIAASDIAEISGCCWSKRKSMKMFCSLEEKRTKWNRFLYFVEIIVNQTLFNVSLKCTSQMNRRSPGEMALLHQPAITARSLTPSSVLLSFPTYFYVCGLATQTWLLWG